MRANSKNSKSQFISELEALRKNEERYRLVLRGGNDGFWDYDLKTGTMYFSPRYKEILGYHEEEFPNVLDSWRNKVYPDDLERAKSGLQKIIDGEADHVESEFRMWHKDGSLRWVHSRGTGVKNDDGIVCRVAGTSTDITERKQAEARLAESEEQYRLLTEHAVSAVAVHEIMFDANGRPVDFVFLSVNPAFEPQTGIKPSKVLGHRATEAIPGIEQTPLIEVFGQVVISGKSASFEHYFEPLGRYYLVNAYKIGEKRFAAVFTDITELKQAELEKEAVIEKLEKALAEVNTLQGLIPICSRCKKIKDDKGYWNEMERYIEEHSDALFSHGICGECSNELYGNEDWYLKMKKKKGYL